MASLLEGKVALVTGAGHGIGRGHALELAKHGAKVVVNDLGSSVRGEGAGRDADEVVSIIEKRGGTAIADYGDVGDEEQAGAMVQRGIDQWGQIDIVVNNAGIVRDRAIWNMEAGDYDLVMRVHVRGTWLTSRAAARHWRERAKSGSGSGSTGGKVSGRIINTISGAGLLGNFGQTNYATAKAAIMGLTQTLSLELGSIGVTVNAIGPGAVTRLSAGVSGSEAREPDDYEGEEWSALNPAMSSPVVAWLASDEADFVSGQCIRAMRNHIYLMQGWTEIKTLDNGGKYWDATTLGRLMETELFGTRAPGLRLGS
jgi:NAD(P)-dependent dehydrogenase (short-subunit alcohol dehydrogenase family)